MEVHVYDNAGRLIYRGWTKRFLSLSTKRRKDLV